MWIHEVNALWAMQVVKITDFVVHSLTGWKLGTNITKGLASDKQGIPAAVPDWTKVLER